MDRLKPDPAAAESKATASSIAACLGPVSVPGGMDCFDDAIGTRWPSVIRQHRNVEPSELPFDCDVVPWYSLGHRLLNPETRASRHLFYAGGDYYLQDAGSLLALAVAGADQPGLKGQTVCDLCAAPGGKATGVLEALGESGFLLANEPIRSRLPPLRYNLARTGSDRYAVSSLDPQKLAERLPHCFDWVLVDAPCSGQAMVAKGGQTDAAFSTKQIEHSALRQQRILDAAVRLLRPGGRLVYSTCTFAYVENESQVQWVVDRGWAQPCQGNADRLGKYQTEPGCYRLWPHLHGCAGAFAAALEVTADEGAFVNGSSVNVSKGRPRSKRRNQRERRESSSEIPSELKTWFGQHLESLRLVPRDAVLQAFPMDAPEWTHQSWLSGPELAYRTGRTWKPSHEVAMRRNGFLLANQIATLDVASAVAFMGGHPVGCDRRGWSVVASQGRPLGWVKSNGDTGKNHLPTAARIPIETHGCPASPI